MQNEKQATEQAQNKNGEVVIYDDGSNKPIGLRILDGDMWATQQEMADAYGCGIKNISYHINQILESGELDENQVVQKIWITAKDGKQYPMNIYKSDMMINAGFRVNSKKASNFRIWATQVLKEKVREEFEKRYNNYQPATNISNFEMFNFLSSFIYLPIKTLSNITKTHASTLRTLCSNGKFNARKVLFEGVAGSFHWEIAVSSLKPDMQKQVFEYFDCQNKLKPLADLYQAVLSGDCDAITKAKLFFLNNNLITG